MEADVVSFKHSGESPPLPTRVWSIVITLYLNPVDPGKGTTRRFSAYNAASGTQGPQRMTHFEALQDIPPVFRGEATRYQ